MSNSQLHSAYLNYIHPPRTLEKLKCLTKFVSNTCNIVLFNTQSYTVLQGKRVNCGQNSFNAPNNNDGYYNMSIFGSTCYFHLLYKIIWLPSLSVCLSVHLSVTEGQRKQLTSRRKRPYLQPLCVRS